MMNQTNTELEKLVYNLSNSWICFGILSDENIREYFKLGCEVKALGRGHVQRLKKECQKEKREKK